MGVEIVEIWQDNRGNTIDFNVDRLYGESTEGFDFRRGTYIEAKSQMKKWGYKKVGVENARPYHIFR